MSMSRFNQGPLEIEIHAWVGIKIGRPKAVEGRGLWQLTVCYGVVCLCMQVCNVVLKC